MEVCEMREEARVITRGLIQTAIRRRKGCDRMSVKDIKIKKHCVTDDTFMGATFIVTVTGEESDGEKVYDLFIKTTRRSEILREIALLHTKRFQKEEMAFCEIIPDMMRYQSDRVTAYLGPSVPQFYHSIVDDTSGIIIIENICPRGYILADKAAGLNYDECKLVMDRLAVFHALSFAKKDKNVENLRKYKYLFHNVFSMPTPFHLVQCLHSSVSLVVNSSTDDKIKAKAKLLATLDLREAQAKLLEQVEPYSLICHGDLWCNNLLFKYKDGISGESPEDVKLLDLQDVRYALPTTDLVYFFFTSTTKVTRNNHLKDLLRFYHSVFVQTLERLGTDFPEFTFEVLDSLFTGSIMFGVIRAFMLLPGFLARPEDVNFNGRTAADLQKFVINFCEQIPEKENVQLLVERLIGVVEDAVELGAL